MPSEYQEIDDDYQQELGNLDERENPYTIYGYDRCNWKRVTFIVLNIVFLGAPYLFSIWSSWFKARILYVKVPLNIAEIILVADKHGNSSFVEVKTDTVTLPSRGRFLLRYFFHQYSKYAWFPEHFEFAPFENLLPQKTLNEIVSCTNGLKRYQTQELLKLYGYNDITIEIKSYWKLFIEEILNPFYIFQIFSVVLWCVDDYIIYAGCVLFLLLMSAIGSLYQTRKQSEALHNVIKSDYKEVHVVENTVEGLLIIVTKNPKDLVPGDVMVIPREGCKMYCDALLLTGTCLVNESSLTGESIPVTKTPPHLSPEIYNPNVHKKHTLFAGTDVIQARYYGGEHVLAYVCRTGFNTTKGALVKSILFPTPVGMKFYEDAMKFLCVLGGLALCGVSYCLYLYISRGATIKITIVRALDIFTILVPPALPAAMTVGMSYSQSRLKQKKVFCISPQRINICGKIKLACFDKTGTLTNEGLDFHCIVPYGPDSSGVPIFNIYELSQRNLFIQAMATCHSLTTINNRLIGDPLDLTMFETTDWILEEAGNSEDTRYDLLAPTIVKPKSSGQAGGGDVVNLVPYELGIVQQFVFSSSQQCMSVIVRQLGATNMLVFTKGAPEKIVTLCKPETVPPHYYPQLVHYSVQGYRLIAFGFKELPQRFRWKDAQTIDRESIECDLTFLGFMVMKNSLKQETKPVIEELHKANIRTAMITGDNIMTAVSVGRDCNMINKDHKVIILKTRRLYEDQAPKLVIEGIGEEININNVDFSSGNYHFAMEGKTWTDLCDHFRDLVPEFLMHTSVFARFQPDQKTQLISHFQKLDYIVSMVGDGANDCGALKAAHVGVSLSQAEASVAAPFTSAEDNISCIVELIKEGRCALVTSFATFKYMALYSLIQFISVIILYQSYSILGDMQFLFIDLIITTSLAVTIGRQGPPKRLVSQRPMGSLMAGKNIVPMFVQITICALVQAGAIFYLRTESWFNPLKPGLDETVLCWENTVIFLVSCYQYIIMACVYSKGQPFRESIFTNYLLLLCAVVLIIFVTSMVVRPHLGLAKLFEVEPFSHDLSHHRFRLMLLIFPAVQLCLASLIEAFVADSAWLPKFLHIISRKQQPKNKYKRLGSNVSFKRIIQTDSNLPSRGSCAPIMISKKRRISSN